MIGWLRRLSWKWKLIVLFIGAMLALMVVLMSDGGQQWMCDKVIEKYKETPEAERRDSPWADRYLQLAYFRGYVCGDSKNAMEMYKSFLGIQPDAKGKTVFDNRKLNGLCSEDGKTGWGPAHPRAPEAYYNYMELYEVLNSAQYTGLKCWQYYALLYDWMKKYGPDKKPNPMFKAYWDKIQILGRKSLFPPPAGMDFSAHDAPEVEKQ